MTGIGHLFKTGAIVKVILNMDESKAYIQNADTNKYLENKFSQKADLEDGKVPATQLPEMNYIPNSEKGKASGVATLDSSGKVPTSQLPRLSYSKEETLSEATKTMYGLNASATPNTVFQKLAMPYGYYGFDVTTVFSDGTPAPNIVLEGLEDFSGNTVTTDGNGRCPIAVSKSPTPSVSISGYLDVEDTTATISADDSTVFTPVTITLEKKTVTHELKNSLTARTTGASTYDITVVGGGGGGTTGSNGGGGGGGGYMTTELNVPITTTTLSVVVGAGGGRATDVYNTVYAGSGGQSYVADGNGETLVSANGGSGAYGTSGGAGNGNGGNSGQKGNNAAGYLFNDESLGVPGGGGGAGTYRGGAEAGVWNQLPGGSPYGGGGGHNYKDQGWEIHYYGGEDGKGPGGGGGAGYGNNYGGNGAAGAVFMRARFE